MILGLLVTLIAGFALDGEVHRWSSAVPLNAKEITLSDHGVSVRLEGEPIPVVVPWYDLRALPEGWAGESQRYREVAMNAHRARERRLRGDPVSAGPIYEQLASQLHPTHSLQRADIEIGLMQFRLVTQGSSPISAWLGAVQELDHGMSLESTQIDPETGLHPAIIPVFIEPQPLEEEQPQEYPQREQILFELYGLAAAGDRGEEIDAELEELLKRIKSSASRDTGMRFVHDIVGCQLLTDPTKRRAKRESLYRRIRSGTPGWMNSWVRLAIGVSLMNEEDQDLREQGVLECIAVVVAGGDTPDSIIQLGAQLAADYLRTTERATQADTLLISAMREQSETPVAKED